MSNTVARREDWGQLGPAMKALPNDRWRAFVQFYLLETLTNSRRNNHGSQAVAVRKAGFGRPGTKPDHMANIAWRIVHDERAQFNPRPRT